MLEENIKNKLDYIGLNLDKIPNIIKKQCKVKYRPQNAQDEKNYRIYKYINVNDIDILITPTNRLTDITEKYDTAIPLKEYLSKENKDLLEQFLRLVKQISIEDIDELNKQQEELEKIQPLEVKFNKDYLWQIYYSTEENRYFMLAPITETEFAQIFYVLKEQLSEKTTKKIFVPICCMDYSGKILTREEIKKLENMLWLFTNNWASIYEVSDKSGKTKLVLTGKTKILETLQSSYIMSFENREEALNFYNLISAMFTLQTNYSKFYNFNVKVMENGSLQFQIDNDIFNQENIVEFITNKYIKNSNELKILKEKKANLEVNLSKLKENAYQKQHEFLEKQKEISNYLECRKTFLGRVKYFFSKKKVRIITDKTKENKIKEGTIKINQFDSSKDKSIYTLQELMELTSALQNETNIVNNLELDTEAAKRRIAILDKKIENAMLYIKEIDSHKKSLLDFWRFTSKDESNRLAEALEKNNESKIKKSFNINLDLEDVKRNLDTIVREKFTKQELDSSFVATTNLLEDINRTINDEDIEEDNLKKLKNEFDKNKLNFSLDLQMKNVKLSKQISHREIERNIFSILNINENTNLEEYKAKLKDVIKDLNLAQEKTSLNIELPLYFATNDELPKGFIPFSINPEETTNGLVEGEINIYKIIVDDQIKYIPLTNIVYFNNLNKTLPVGMDCGTKVLANTKDLKEDSFNKEQNNILTFIDNKIKILKLNIYKY